MTIKEFQDTIRKACIDFTQDNQIGVIEIILLRDYEFGNGVPLDYKIEIKVK